MPFRNSPSIRLMFPLLRVTESEGESSFLFDEVLSWLLRFSSKLNVAFGDLLPFKLTSSLTFFVAFIRTILPCGRRLRKSPSILSPLGFTYVAFPLDLP